MPSRDSFLVPPVGAPDRRATVARHAVRLSAIDPRSPLQVGNGEFAFAVDPTGLQTFPEAYPVEGGGSLLGTMAQWAWHSLPAPRAYSLTETLRDYDTPHGRVPYVDLSSETHDAADQTDAERWLRGNPHKIQLAAIGLWTGAAPGQEPGSSGPEPGSRLEPPTAHSLSGVDQLLDLWTGVIASRFELGNARYAVTTAAHPERDAVAIAIDGPAGTSVGVRLRFPYGSDEWANACDWTRPEAHTTTVERTASGWRIRRHLDDTHYEVLVHAHGLALHRAEEHDLVFHAEGGAQLVVEFVSQAAGTSRPVERLTVQGVLTASARHWESFWSSGACVDLCGSEDPRAVELERRIVLSQYLTAINCAGSVPPAETGLLLNSWRGKFHLEMHWFHALHFAAWGRSRLLERSLSWYAKVLPQARETARRQGLAGARWPKQVGPEGRETPSSIGPFLVWQQPHPIFLAEMCFRADPAPEKLRQYAELVFDTAELMAAFAAQAGGGRAGFELGPPIVPSQESYAASRATARSPTFELAYWSWALDTACTWWGRMGRTAPSAWRTVADGMVKPQVLGGIYTALATPPYLVRDDHPGMLAALGMLPRTRLIEPSVMARTLDEVLRDWDWDSTWGWDYPLAAMTATRLGRREDAVAALLMDRPKNTYLVNGHNRQAGRLPVYLPGNGGLLAAVALMAGGWDGSSGTAPGFGQGWSVAHEGFVRLP